MQVVENVLRLENPVPNLSLTIGSFDGVHLGHRSLLAALFEESREAGGPSGVMILKPHPRQFFSPESAPNLLTCDTQQRRLLEEAGVDYLFILPFCASVACADRWDFLSGIVVGRCGTRRLVVGHDFRFGRGARGNYEYLLESAPELGLRVRQVDALVIKGQCVSSTLIRELVISGEMEQIPKWLGRRYAIEGTVVRGRGIGAGRFGQARQGCQQFWCGRGHLCALTHLAEHAVDRIQCFEHHIHQFRVDPALTLAQDIEHVLRDMAALHQLVQLKEAGAPFYSVETAKDCIEQVSIVRPAFQLDQLLGQLLKNFAGFYQEILKDFFIGAEAH